jgi:superkiller protein 3
MGKDTKVVLQEAKNHLMREEYVITIKICKKVLKEEKSNYNALVLMATAMHKLNHLNSELLIPLKKATEIQPDNPTAWQGLLKYYEGQPDNAEIWTELVHVYNKLLLIIWYSYYSSFVSYLFLYFYLTKTKI